MAPVNTIEGIFLVLSNLFLLPAIILCYKNGRTAEFAFLWCMMKVSFFYHMCQAEFYCIFYNRDTFQLLDHFMVYSTFFWLALYLTKVELKRRIAAYIYFVVAVFPALLLYVHTYWFPFLIIGYGIAAEVFFISFVKGEIRKVYGVNIIIIFFCLMLGVILYMVGDEPEGHLYAWTHIVWHATSMIAIYFVIDINDGKNKITRYFRKKYNFVLTFEATSKNGIEFFIFKHDEAIKPNLKNKKFSSESSKKGQGASYA